MGCLEVATASKCTENCLLPFKMHSVIGDNPDKNVSTPFVLFCSFGLLCGLRSSNGYGYDSDYSTAGKGYPLLPKTPIPPIPIGEGYITGDIDIDLSGVDIGNQENSGTLEEADISKLLILDGHRVAYRVGFVNGYM